MADNLNDLVSQWTLGDLYRGARSSLSRAASALNQSGLGLTPAAKASYRTKQRPTSFQDAATGTPFVLGGKLGFKNAKGEFEVRGDLDGGPSGSDTRGAGDLGPGLTAPAPYGDPAERARESEKRRMMQQYASKEYWEGETGKAMLALGNQSRYTGQDLPGFYKAQDAVGIGSFDEVMGGLAQLDNRYKEGGDLRKWAEANKALALREYMKRYPQGRSTEPSLGNIELAMKEGRFAAPEGSPDPLGNGSELKTGVAPEIVMGPPPGLNAELNRVQTAAIQAVVPQSVATDTGTKAMNMQPSSAMATGYQQPAEEVTLANMPEEQGAALDPKATALRELWKRKIQSASTYRGG